MKKERESASIYSADPCRPFGMGSRVGSGMDGLRKLSRRQTFHLTGRNVKIFWRSGPQFPYRCPVLIGSPCASSNSNFYNATPFYPRRNQRKVSSSVKTLPFANRPRQCNAEESQRSQFTICERFGDGRDFPLSQDQNKMPTKRSSFDMDVYLKKC